MKILYGISSINSIDVTHICFSNLTNNNICIIPFGNINRSSIFNTPLNSIKKKIIILNDNNITEYDDNTEIKINIENNTIETINIIDYINEKIKNIHSKLKLKFGNFNQELPEQKMTLRYLTGNEKVLEIGGNIGRNSLIIAHILENDINFVSLESNENIANQLKENKELNNFNFHIEKSALSKRKLIQKGWDTIPNETLIDGYKWVNTITLDELKSKYNIEFDTLVLDCEGAFYYILMDMPEILNNINLIIMENDYHNILHKNYIDEILLKNNFYIEYLESGGWGPCKKNFFEVWKKLTF